MADEQQKELRQILMIRRLRLQRAESRVVQAQGAEKRAIEEVARKEKDALRAASENAERESELALGLFNHKTHLSHIEKFRRDVGELRKHTASAREEVEVAKKTRVEAKTAVREAAELQRSAYRAVEKLEFVLQEIKDEQAIVADRRSPDE